MHGRATAPRKRESYGTTGSAVAWGNGGRGRGWETTRAHRAGTQALRRRGARRRCRVSRVRDPVASVAVASRRNRCGGGLGDVLPGCAGHRSHRVPLLPSGTQSTGTETHPVSLAFAVAGLLAPGCDGPGSLPRHDRFHGLESPSRRPPLGARRGAPLPVWGLRWGLRPSRPSGGGGSWRNRWKRCGCSAVTRGPVRRGTHASLLSETGAGGHAAARRRSLASSINSRIVDTFGREEGCRRASTSSCG